MLHLIRNFYVAIYVLGIEYCAQAGIFNRCFKFKFFLEIVVLLPFQIMYKINHLSLCVLNIFLDFFTYIN